MTEHQLTTIHNLAVLVAAKNVLADLRPSEWGRSEQLQSFIDPLIGMHNYEVSLIELEHE